MNHLIRTIRSAWTTRTLRNCLRRAGLSSPSNLASMYLGEPAEYTAAAILAVNTRGE